MKLKTFIKHLQLLERQGGADLQVIVTTFAGDEIPTLRRVKIEPYDYTKEEKHYVLISTDIGLTGKERKEMNAFMGAVLAPDPSPARGQLKLVKNT